MPSRRAVTAAALLLARPALAQTRYPDRPVRLVVPYSAGGVADTIARVLQPKIGEHLGQALVVENRTGASGAIAAAAVAQSAPDGHTLMLEGATFATLPLVNTGLPVNYETAFVPVAQSTAQPYFIAVRRDFPAADIRGFIAEARRRPGEVTYGTPGVAHIGHFMGELLQSSAGIQLEHIPFRGGADASREVGAGRIDAAIISHSSLLPALEAGRARLVAVTSAERRPLAPDVPALAELFPGYDLGSWTGIFAPAGTPPAALQRFTAALHHAIGDRETRDRLVAGGNDPVLSDAERFAAVIRRDREVARRIVAASPTLRG
jgi:tripartite-type tricarboxylate transporter receptor subunit TctC